MTGPATNLRQIWGQVAGPVRWKARTPATLGLSLRLWGRGVRQGRYPVSFTTFPFSADTFAAMEISSVLRAP